MIRYGRAFILIFLLCLGIFSSPLPAQEPAGAAAKTAEEKSEFERGLGLFQGAPSLKNGGPSCIDCHGFEGVGLFGGGNLGPDLTDVTTAWSVPILTVLLKSMPWAVMTPVYAHHPLTDEEIRDLSVFLSTGVEHPYPNYSSWTGPFAFAGFALFIAGQALYWRKRMRRVRRSLVDRSRLPGRSHG